MCNIAQTVVPATDVCQERVSKFVEYALLNCLKHFELEEHCVLHVSLQRKDMGLASVRFTRAAGGRKHKKDTALYVFF